MLVIAPKLLNRRLQYLRESSINFIRDKPATPLKSEFDLQSRENQAMQQTLTGPADEERVTLDDTKSDLVELIQSSMHRNASMMIEPASKKRKSQLDHVGDFIRFHKVQRKNPPHEYDKKGSGKLAPAQPANRVETFRDNSQAVRDTPPYNAVQQQRNRSQHL